MTGYDYAARRPFDRFNELDRPALFALAGDAADAARLRPVFGWHESTVQACENLDENVRFTGYAGYDFLSLIYIDIADGRVLQREINIFFSKDYLFLVLPPMSGEQTGETRLAGGRLAGNRLVSFRREFDQAMADAAERPVPLVFLYHFILDALASDFSEALEQLEDDCAALSERIEERPDKAAGGEMARLRKAAYTCKKILRALSYIGGQITEDGNGLTGDEYARYFRGLETRLMRLYDFADHLFALAGELRNTYDSKLTAQTNETVNKLTVVTLFASPLTVVAGIYGMNFTHMPELNWRFGYPASLGLMALICLVIFIIMKKKRWL